MIDKTEVLEKEIVVFPSIYIEGAAASGKSTAVQMLLEKHSEVDREVFLMDVQEPMHFQERLQTLLQKMESEKVWVVFENLPGQLSEKLLHELAAFLCQMPENGRAILVSREQPEKRLLELLWKRKMELIPQRALQLKVPEIRRLVEQVSSPLDPEEVYDVTGGWAGCVDLMLRLSQKEEGKTVTAEMLRGRYEIDSYICSEILDTLSIEEQKVMELGRICPWLKADLCLEILNLADAWRLLEQLERKGMLVYCEEQKYWKTAALFRVPTRDKQELSANSKIWRYLGLWYRDHGYVKEALDCLEKSDDKKEIRDCMFMHYKEIPFLGVPYESVLGWKENKPEFCYLRGMYAYAKQDFEGLLREISRMEKTGLQSRKEKEIYLNLTFVNPRQDLKSWLILAEALGGKEERFSLYHGMGYSMTCLCGMRDLNELFFCSKREEKKWAQLWKNCFSTETWSVYQLARIDYYIETNRKNQVPEEDWMLLNETRHGSWQKRLACLYLFCKWQAVQPDQKLAEQILQMKQSLLQEQNETCVSRTKAISSLYASFCGEPEALALWLRKFGWNLRVEVREENFLELCCVAKGYLFCGQYALAEKVLQSLVPYMQAYRRTRFLTELLFMQALICQEEGSRGQMLRNVIEAFMVGGSCRYVWLYARYGQNGKAVLMEYLEWLNSGQPDKQKRKKQYQYGNVLHMPMESYLGVVMRGAERYGKHIQVLPKQEVEERLTMMENLILQSISRGLSNGEICQELNLKLPTVKSHIYSMYKKLGVSSRVQAILRGKERGLLE